MVFSKVWGSKNENMILPAQEEDYDRIALLHAGAFSRGWSANEIARMNDDPAVSVLVARRVGRKPGELDGFNIVRQAADEGEILSIVVDSTCRGNGLGAKLMREAITRFQTDRLASVFLEVAKSNLPAVSLYTRLGFQTVGERKSYYTIKNDDPSSADLSDATSSVQSGETKDSADKATALVMRLALV